MSTSSPWMTLQQVCDYAQRSYETVRRAAVECQRSSGERGLKGAQRDVNATWRFHVEDVDRWVAGEAPVAPARKLRRAS